MHKLTHTNSEGRRTLSSSPFKKPCTVSPKLPSQIHESNINPLYPLTNACSNGSKLLYPANRFLDDDIALCTIAKDTSFTFRLQFEDMRLQHPSQTFWAFKSSAEEATSADSASVQGPNCKLLHIANYHDCIKRKIITYVSTYDLQHTSYSYLLLTCHRQIAPAASIPRQRSDPIIHLHPPIILVRVVDICNRYA